MSIRPFNSCLLGTLSRVGAIFAFATLGHIGLLAQSVPVSRSSGVDFNISGAGIPTVWKAGTLRILDGSLGVTNGTGTISLYMCGPITGTATSYATGELVYGVDPFAPKCSNIFLGKKTNGVWKEGTIFGVRDNGHSIGPITGTGTIDLYVCGSVTGTVTAYATGEIVCSADPVTPECSDFVVGTVAWKEGTVLGVRDNGHSIGAVSGTGKLYAWVGAGEMTGMATAYTTGEIVYSANDYATTTPYWDGHTEWAAGTKFGVIDKGHGLGVVSASGKVDYHDSGAHITGTATAANGEIVYSANTAATTSEYWDGHTLWATGTILGVTDKGHGLGVVSGSGKMDYHDSGAHITGTATATNGKIKVYLSEGATIDVK